MITYHPLSIPRLGRRWLTLGGWASDGTWMVRGEIVGDVVLTDAGMTNAREMFTRYFATTPGEPLAVEAETPGAVGLEASPCSECGGTEEWYVSQPPTVTLRDGVGDLVADGRVFWALHREGVTARRLADPRYANDMDPIGFYDGADLVAVMMPRRGQEPTR